jgi:DHA2 family methylenomycin A resistance protein-like MFS transporter
MIEGGGVLGWAHPLTLSGLGMFVIALAAFIRVESKTPSPMLPLRLFRDPIFTATTAIGLILNIAFYGLIFVLSLFFQRTQHYSALQTGFAFLPMMGIILGANLISGWIASRVGARIPILAGQIVMIIGCLGLLAVKDYTPYWRLAGQMLAIGAGAGLIVPSMTSALLGTVDKSQSGIAAGILSASRQTGSVVGVALFGTFIAQQDHIFRGLQISLIISSVILFFNFLLAFRIPRHRRNNDSYSRSVTETE